MAWITVALVFDISTALAVAPNPLQDAYWRFEEGPAGSPVPGPDLEEVKDSINSNDMSIDNRTNVAPIYTNEVAPMPLRSGLPNELALQFNGAQNLRTRSIDAGNISINNGIIAEGGGFTLEAAFRPDTLGAFQGIVTRTGLPRGDEITPEFFIGNLPTLALKVRGDNNNLQIEHWDQAANLVSVQSDAPLVASQWYAAAAVNDGSLLSLYLDRNDGNGYVLQGAPVAVDGALFQGGFDEDTGDPIDDWDHSWLIGRSLFNQDTVDWFHGIIDEVRLSNRALSPQQFLFYIPEPGGATLALLGLAGLLCRRGGRPRRS